jgi:hypothetical protein
LSISKRSQIFRLLSNWHRVCLFLRFNLDALNTLCWSVAWLFLWCLGSLRCVCKWKERLCKRRYIRKRSGSDANLWLRCQWIGYRWDPWGQTFECYECPRFTRFESWDICEPTLVNRINFLRSVNIFSKASNTEPKNTCYIHSKLKFLSSEDCGSGSGDARALSDT